MAARKNLVHDGRVAQCDATVRQTPHVFSDSPGRVDLDLFIETENKDFVMIKFSISDGSTQTGSYAEESEQQAQGSKKMASTLPVIGQ